MTIAIILIVFFMGLAVVLTVVGSIVGIKKENKKAKSKNNTKVGSNTTAKPIQTKVSSSATTGEVKAASTVKTTNRKSKNPKPKYMLKDYIDCCKEKHKDDLNIDPALSKLLSAYDESKDQFALLWKEYDGNKNEEVKRIVELWKMVLLDEIINNLKLPELTCYKYSNAVHYDDINTAYVSSYDLKRDANNVAVFNRTFGPIKLISIDDIASVVKESKTEKHLGYTPPKTSNLGLAVTQAFWGTGAAVKKAIASCQNNDKIEIKYYGLILFKPETKLPPLKVEEYYIDKMIEMFPDKYRA